MAKLETRVKVQLKIMDGRWFVSKVEETRSINS